jgi:anti-sigma-K factor RskA
VLSPEEAAAVLAAAENDPALADNLAELQAVVAELARMAPSASINRGRSAGIRSRLVSRAAASGEGRPATRQGGPLASVTPPRSRPAVEKMVTPAHPQPAWPGSAERPGGRPERRETPRVSTERRTESQPVPASMERRGRFWKRTLGVLAAAAVLLSAAGIYALWHERDAREAAPSAAAAIATANIATHDSLYRTVDSLRTQLAQRDSLITALRSPGTRIMDLASYMPPAPPGRAFWDPSHQHLMITITGLKPPDPGRTYQLWVMARGHAEPMSAGTFTPDSTGRAEMTSEIPVEPNRLRRVVVTDEPMGGSPAPTGHVLFAGR